MTQSATGKRYADLPDVRISESSIPAALLPILGVAKEWAIVGDDALERAIRKAGKEKVSSAVEIAWPLRAEIARFAYESQGAKTIPVPDEVVMFQMLGWSLNRLQTEVGPESRPNKTPLPTPVESPSSNQDQVPGAADL